MRTVQEIHKAMRDNGNVLARMSGVFPVEVPATVDGGGILCSVRARLKKVSPVAVHRRFQVTNESNISISI